MVFLAMINELEDKERECAEKIYLDYGEKIYSIALKITKNRHDAEDVLDNVMISIMKNIDRFINASRNDIEAQICIYSRNDAINSYNRRKRRNEKEVSYIENGDEESPANVSDTGADTENIIISEETVQLVRKYLGKLPVEYEEALTLVYRYGYSHAEAAKILHISENNFTVRVHRAKKKLLSISGGELYDRTTD